MRVAEIMERFGGACEGDESVEVHTVTGVDIAGPGDTTFALDERHLALAEEAGAACVIVPHRLRPSRTTLLRCDSPQRYAIELLRWFHPPSVPPAGVHASAIIDEGATVDPRACVGPHVTIGADCRIAAGAILMASVVVGDQCEIGADTIIHPNVTLYARTRIGARVIIHAGAVIGADGFGYFPADGKLLKWPHVGNVVIEDDAEIGANTCIDRAKFGTTLIQRGAKLDNLVQIAHNCRVGPDVVIAGQTGLSGSAVLEAGVVCGGQVGVGEHRTIGRGARIGGQTGVMGHIAPGAEVFGHPAQPVNKALRQAALLRFLTENRTLVRKLVRGAGGRRLKRRSI